MFKTKQKTSYQKGLDAEAQAAKQLKRDGYKVLAVRYKTRYGEIDIVAQKTDVIVFVEVKTRRNLDDALYAITPKNRRRIEQAAMYYVAEHPDFVDFAMRFDVMAFGKCDTKSGGIWAEHLDNAWECGA